MIIALVGAGGKTTLSRKIGYELSRMGCRVILTTTTKIYPPQDGSVYIGPAQSIPADDFFVTAAKAALENGKLQGFTPAELEQAPPLFDHVIVEADGANRKPVKAPNGTEPVYPHRTDIVVGVIGLDCIGKPIDDEFVHRSALFADITGAQPGDAITAQHLNRLIRHPHGLFRSAPPESKKIVFLNKADTMDSAVMEDVTAVIKNAPVPILITSRETDWFSDFYTAYMEGYL